MRERGTEINKTCFWLKLLKNDSSFPKLTPFKMRNMMLVNCNAIMFFNGLKSVSTFRFDS